MASRPTVPLISLYDSPGICVGTTFRGVPAADDSYSGFSLCHYVGDAEEHWQRCRHALADHLGIPLNHLIVPRQTHSVNVALISSLPVADRDIEGVDAVVTTMSGVAVGVNTADCLPVLLFDEVAGVAGAVHAGWRGAVGGIVDRSVDVMVSAGAVAARIHAYIAPHIRQCCFEVGEDVAAQFSGEDVLRHQQAKPHVSLASYVKRALVLNGVPEENISDPGECTRCHPDRYFSARALGIASGRNFSYIMLK